MMVTHNNTHKKEINSVCTQRQDNQNKNQIRLTLKKTISSADVYSTDIYHAAPAFTSTLTPCSPSALPNNNRFCSTTKKHKKKYLDAFCGTGRQRTRAFWNSYQPPIQPISVEDLAWKTQLFIIINMPMRIWKFPWPFFLTATQNQNKLWVEPVQLYLVFHQEYLYSSQRYIHFTETY